MNYQSITGMISSALEEANRLKVAISISVVDKSGHPVALYRQEECSYFALASSRNKALTASQFKVPTHILLEVGEKLPIMKNAMSKNPEIELLPGGVPIMMAGKCIGGLGVAGGDFEQDRTIAEYALNYRPLSL